MEAYWLLAHSKWYDDEWIKTVRVLIGIQCHLRTIQLFQPLLRQKITK